MQLTKYYCNHCGREVIYNEVSREHEYVIWPMYKDFRDREAIHLCDDCKESFDEWIHHSEDLIKRY